jgi:predicted signal transduction protein with EAL and GGDEF domain
LEIGIAKNRETAAHLENLLEAMRRGLMKIKLPPVEDATPFRAELEIKVKRIAELEAAVENAGRLAKVNDDLIKDQEKLADEAEVKADEMEALASQAVEATAVAEQRLKALAEHVILSLPDLEPGKSMPREQIKVLDSLNAAARKALEPAVKAPIQFPAAQQKMTEG